MTDGYAGDGTVQVVFEDMGCYGTVASTGERLYDALVNGLQVLWSVGADAPDSAILDEGLHAYKRILMARHAREVSGMVDEGEVLWAGSMI